MLVASLTGEKNGRVCGGAEEDFLDFLALVLLRATLIFAGGDRTGDESSAPD